jgi:hypothetical protein
MFWWTKKDPQTEAEKKLQQIADLLFPPLETSMSPDGQKYQIDYSVDSNLDAVLIDLEDGHNDRITQKTIRTISDRLLAVRRLLEAFAEIDPEAKYMIVDDGSFEADIQDQESTGC